MWHAAGPAQDRRPAYLTLGIALAFFTAAVPLELTGFGIAIAWALEAAGLAWLSRRFADDKLSIATCTVLLLALGASILSAQQPELVDHLAAPRTAARDLGGCSGSGGGSHLRSGSSG